MPLRGDTPDQDFTRVPIEIPDNKTHRRRKYVSKAVS
jgi:hypothetical protein